MAGIVMPRDPELRARVHDRIEPLTITLLLPVFFVVVGLSTRIDTLDRPYLWGLTALVVAVATVGKWGGSTVAARLMGENWYDANTIGLLMNTRGLTELVILSVGLELGVVNATVFTIMVIMALVTTLMATPLIAVVGHLQDRATTSRAGRPRGDDLILGHRIGCTSHQSGDQSAAVRGSAIGQPPMPPGGVTLRIRSSPTGKVSGSEYHTYGDSHSL